MPRAKTTPRQRQPSKYASVAVLIEDNRRFDDLVEQAGLTKHRAFSTLLRLAELAPEELRIRAGFPVRAEHASNLRILEAHPSAGS